MRWQERARYQARHSGMRWQERARYQARHWEDEMVGAARGRYPVNTAGVAFYAGEKYVVAVDPMNGPSDLVLWFINTLTYF